jgi:hypothetical protein
MKAAICHGLSVMTLTSYPSRMRVWTLTFAGALGSKRYEDLPASMIFS